MPVKLITLASMSGLWLGGLAMAGMTLQITLDVFLRYFFGRGVYATLEISAFYYMVILAFAPSGYVQLRQEHIVVELFAAKLGAFARRLIDTAALVISSGIVLLYAAAGTLKALKATAEGEAYEVFDYPDLPLWPMRWVVVFGFATLLSVMLSQLLFRVERIPGDVNGGSHTGGSDA